MPSPASGSPPGCAGVAATRNGSAGTTLCSSPNAVAERCIEAYERNLERCFGAWHSTKECEVVEGHLMSNDVHMLLRVPPKRSVSQATGYIKGKSAIHLARVYQERKRNFVGQHFWARGYFVSTVGRDEAVTRAYIRNQE